MTFGLISEGITDRPPIEATIGSYFLKKFSQITPVINPLQPKDKNQGGWTRILAYCSTQEFRNSFDFNDYVIIQIDTDKHEEKGFDVKKQQDNQQLILAIQNRIIQSIGEKFYATVKDRILFAVSMDSIECWFLPFYAKTNEHKSKIKSCCTTLNQYIKKLGFTIDCKKAEGSYQYYQKVSILLSKKKAFFASYSHNESLAYFVDIELAKIK